MYCQFAPSVPMACPISLPDEEPGKFGWWHRMHGFGSLMAWHVTDGLALYLGIVRLEWNKRAGAT